MSVFSTLPSAYRALLPELFSLEMPVETRADCYACHMVPSSGPCDTARRHFLESTRCCTYHPILPNYLVGRALARDDRGAALIRRRIEEASCLSPIGITVSSTWRHNYLSSNPDEYGRNEAQRCPYWAGGLHTCGIWRDRGAMCMTWYCRYTDGPRGRVLWEQLRVLLQLVEHHLGQWLVETGAPPREPAVPPEMWEGWYRDCSARLDEADETMIAGLRTARMQEALALVRARESERDTPLPDRPVPTVRAFEDAPGGVRLIGYSPIDSRIYPKPVLRFLRLLDGEVTWHQALASWGEPENCPLDEASIQDLYDAGLVGPILEEEGDVHALETHLASTAGGLAGELPERNLRVTLDNMADNDFDPDDKESGKPLVLTLAGQDDIVPDHLD